MLPVALIMLLGAALVCGCVGGPAPSESFDAVASTPNGTVTLPEPQYDSETSVEEALRERRSVRSYADQPLTLAEISQLLWAAQGITSLDGKRTAPSAGALYPLEVYVVAGMVDDLAPGIYRYQPREHRLIMIAAGDLRGALQASALNQAPVRDAPVDIVISAVPERTTGKYGDRGIRYIHMEAGHAAQNIYLQAESLELGTVTIGAFDDAGVKGVVNMTETEIPLYIIPVGRKR